jgi:hypothetical protein
MPTPREGSYRTKEQSTLVLYAFLDPEVWEKAGRERRAWGRSRAVIHVLDNDHVAIEFKPGGALMYVS